MRRFAAQISATFAPPVMQARAWAAAAPSLPDRPLLNLSQAAPVDPPPETLRTAMADALRDEASSHLYGPVLGRPDLRAEVAARWSTLYGGEIAAEEVAITSGCNQAFCAAVSTLADAGDNLILPTPWYFNHKMWLDMAGIEARPCPTGPGMIPEAERAADLIDARTRALVLVTPNNPTGAEYPPETIAAFAELAKAKGIALIVDETYRDFLKPEGAPHQLFQGDWRGTVIHLYSFSKVFRLTGHRIGAMIAEAPRLAEAEKWLDTVTICPSQVGQIGALEGLRRLDTWVAAERAEILHRRDVVAREMAHLPDWSLLGLGAYFAYLEHPFAMPSDILAERLCHEWGLLLLPGTMFGPRQDEGGDGSAERQLRVAFANADEAGIQELVKRLAAATNAMADGLAARSSAP
ncbi:MAG: aminotransferase [Pseudomonadota bacterium]